MHISVGHARHGGMGETFPPAVAGRSHTHQSGIQAILHVALQDTVLDQHSVRRRRTFVVNGQRPTAIVQGAVIDDRYTRRGDALAH